MYKIDYMLEYSTSHFAIIFFYFANPMYKLVVYCIIRSFLFLKQYCIIHPAAPVRRKTIWFCVTTVAGMEPRTLSCVRLLYTWMTWHKLAESAESVVYGWLVDS